MKKLIDRVRSNNHDDYVVSDIERLIEKFESIGVSCSSDNNLCSEFGDPSKSERDDDTTLKSEVFDFSSPKSKRDNKSKVIDCGPAISNAEDGSGDSPVLWTDEDIALLRYGLLEHSLFMIKELRGPNKGHRGRESFDWLMKHDDLAPFSSNNCAKACGVDILDIRRFLLDFDKEKGFIFTR